MCENRFMDRDGAGTGRVSAQQALRVTHKAGRAWRTSLGAASNATDGEIDAGQA